MSATALDRVVNDGAAARSGDDYRAAARRRSATLGRSIVVTENAIARAKREGAEERATQLSAELAALRRQLAPLSVALTEPDPFTSTGWQRRRTWP